MKRFLPSVGIVLITAVVLLLCSTLPKLLLNEKHPQIEHPALDSESPQGIEKCEYLGRALSSSEKFIYNIEGKVDNEKRREIIEGLLNLSKDGTAPEFLTNEMGGIVDSVIIENLTISTVGGAELSLIHCYYEWTHDWSNWIEVYIDAETGKLLYIYMSGQCLGDGAGFAESYPEIISLEGLRDVYAEYMGFTATDSVYSQNPNENAITVTYTDGTSSVNYHINRIYYPGTMYDIKIAPMP